MIEEPRIAVGWHVGTSPPFTRISRLARVGRLLGVDSLWVVDHLVGWFPPAVWDPEFSWLARRGTLDTYFDWQTVLGRLAPHAGRARLAVGVTEPVRRHPVLLAQTALTLSHLTDRPPILGIGSGEAENIAPYGLPFRRPVSRLEEALQILRMIFDGDGPYGFDGEFYRLDDAPLDLRPGPAGPPEIWVAAHGPRMLDLAGRYGDGWYPTLPMAPERYAASLERIRRAAEAAGRNPLAITPSFQAFCVVARSDETAREWLGHPAVRFMALLAPDDVWQQEGLEHPLGAGFGGMIDFVPSRYGRDEILEAIAEVPTELMEGQVLWGSPERIVGSLRALARAGLRHVVLTPISPLVSRRAAVQTFAAVPSIVRRLRSGT